MVFKFSGTVFYTFFHHFSLALVFFSSLSVLALLGFLHLRRGFSKSSTKSKRNWLYVFLLLLVWKSCLTNFSAGGIFGLWKLWNTTSLLYDCHSPSEATNAFRFRFTRFKTFFKPTATAAERSRLSHTPVHWERQRQLPDPHETKTRTKNKS